MHRCWRMWCFGGFRDGLDGGLASDVWEEDEVWREAVFWWSRGGSGGGSGLEFLFLCYQILGWPFGFCSGCLGSVGSLPTFRCLRVFSSGLGSAYWV